MEEVFKTLEKPDVDVETTRSLNMIETIFNRNFGNIFHRNNGPNQFQHVHKRTGPQYKYTHFQRLNKFLPPYLKDFFC